MYHSGRGCQQLRSYACGGGMEGAEATWQISVPSSQFCYQFKSALKHKVYNGARRNRSETL